MRIGRIKRAFEATRTRRRLRNSGFRRRFDREKVGETVARGESTIRINATIGAAIAGRYAAWRPAFQVGTSIRSCTEYGRVAS